MTPAATPPRSIFVTVLGLVVSFIAAIGLLIAFVQTAYVALAVGLDAREFIGFMTLPLALGVPGFVLLASGIGLMKRLNWARVTLIALLVLSAILSLVGPLLMTDSRERAFLDPSETTRFVISRPHPAGAFLMLCLYGYCIHRLTRRDVKREFGVR